MQKQAYVFTENSALAPLEKCNLVIFYEPTKHCFRYDQQTKQLSYIRCDESNWSMWYLLCEDATLHQIVGINDDFRQMQVPGYANKKDQWSVSVPITTP